MNRLLLRLTLTLFSFVFSCQALFAQPVFPSWSEIRVSENHTGLGVRPSVAVSDQNKLWIVWQDGSQWLHSNLNRDGSNKEAFNYYGASFHLENDKWAVFSKRDSAYLSNGQNRDYYYRYMTVTDKSLEDSLPTMLKMQNYLNQGTGSGSSKSELFLDLDSFEWGNGIYFTWNAACTGGGAGMYFASSKFGLIKWHWQDGNPETVIEQKITTYREMGADYFVPRHCLLRLSGPLDNRAALYSRIVLTEDPPYDQFVRSFRYLNLDTDSLGAETILDTIPRIETNVSDLVLARKNGGLDLLTLQVESNTVAVERFDRDGIKTAEFELLHDVWAYSEGHWKRRFSAPSDARDSSRIAGDIQAVRLETEETVVVWTKIENDGNTNIYSALFDPEWKLIGEPKRVNGEKAGDQIGPGMIVHDDNVYVTWLDSRDGDWHVYFRRFTIDQITSVQHLSQHPKSFEVSFPYPNPASSASGHVSISLNSDRSGIVNITVFDILGRIRHQDQYNVNVGSNTRSIDISNLQPGVYNLVFDNGQSINSRQLVVR